MSDSQDVRNPDEQRVERLIPDYIPFPPMDLPDDFTDDMESQIAYMSMISYIEDNQRRENERIAEEKFEEFEQKSKLEEERRMMEIEREREEMRREYEERKKRRSQDFSITLRYLRNFRLDQNISKISSEMESYIHQYIEYEKTIYLHQEELEIVFSFIHEHLYQTNRSRNPISEMEYQRLLSIFDEYIESQDLEEDEEDEYKYEDE